MVGTRNLRGYGGVLRVTGVNGCGKCLLRKVTYPNNYMTNTNAVRAIGGTTTTLRGVGGRTSFASTCSSGCETELRDLRGFSIR